MNDSWKKQFPEWILERGRTYHQMGRVHRLAHHSREISAMVEGTKSYRVAIRFGDGVPIAASCTCPHAAGSHLCKHIAAVLFALEELGYVPEDDSGIPSWEDALEALPAQTLRVILRNLAEQDSVLQELLMQLHQMQMDSAEPEDTSHS